jgi:hypothetical protein
MNMKIALDCMQLFVSILICLKTFIIEGSDRDLTREKVSLKDFHNHLTNNQFLTTPEGARGEKRQLESKSGFVKFKCKEAIRARSSFKQTQRGLTIF